MSAKLFPDAKFLMDWFDAQTEETQLSFTQNVVDAFSKRYLKDVAHQVANFKKGILDDILRQRDIVIVEILTELGSTSSILPAKPILDNSQVIKSFKEEFGTKVRAEVANLIRSDTQANLEKYFEVVDLPQTVQLIVEKQVAIEVKKAISAEVEKQVKEEVKKVLTKEIAKIGTLLGS